MTVYLIPPEEPEYGVMKCKPEGGDAPHDTWTYHRQGHNCDEPGHKTSLYVVIRRCHHCGTYTEWVQVTGQQGGIFELSLDANELTVMLAGLYDNDPDVPF